MLSHQKIIMHVNLLVWIIYFCTSNLGKKKNGYGEKGSSHREGHEFKYNLQEQLSTCNKNFLSVKFL